MALVDPDLIFDFDDILIESDGMQDYLNQMEDVRKVYHQL